jgi:glycosyltransferase involved in cell wall biosynthesis
MEAMACGVVPICLRMRSGVPELIEDGVTGLLSGIAKVISLLRSGA